MYNDPACAGFEIVTTKRLVKADQFTIHRHSSHSQSCQSRPVKVMDVLMARTGRLCHR